jgi:hypothetical protein
MVFFKNSISSAFIDSLFTSAPMEIQPPFTPIVHPKLILAAAVFLQLPECARPRAQQRGKAGRHRFGQSARGLAHSKTLRAVRMSQENACVLDCGGPPPLFPLTMSLRWSFGLFGWPSYKDASPTDLKNPCSSVSIRG